MVHSLPLLDGDWAVSGDADLHFVSVPVDVDQCDHEWFVYDFPEHAWDVSGSSAADVLADVFAAELFGGEVHCHALPWIARAIAHASFHWVVWAMVRPSGLVMLMMPVGSRRIVYFIWWVSSRGFRRGWVFVRGC